MPRYLINFMNDFIIHTDGGSRSNPGPAAIGVVIENGKREKLKEYGEYIGKKTNNEAEYMAAIFALKKVKSLYGKERAKKATVQVFGDSELLAKQMNGEYKIQNANIQPLFLELWNLTIDFGQVSFTSLPRAQNKEADRLVNEALDAQERNRPLL